MSYKNGGFNKTERKIYKLKSDNSRLKQLLIDAQSLIHAPSGNPFEYKLKYDAFQVRIKQEGIE